jgi:hypothetical protein
MQEKFKAILQFVRTPDQKWLHHDRGAQSKCMCEIRNAYKNLDGKPKKEKTSQEI